MKTLKQSRKEKEEAEKRFYAKASKMLAEAKTPENIQEAYEYILKRREKLAKKDIGKITETELGSVFSFLSFSYKEKKKKGTKRAIL